MNVLFDVCLKHRLVWAASKESNIENVNTLEIEKNKMIVSISDQVIIIFSLIILYLFYNGLFNNISNPFFLKAKGI